MASKKGAITLTEADFVKELTKRLGNGTSEKDVREFVKAFKAELIDCLANGYKVTLAGLARFEPKYVAEKPRGEMVRNPATGEMQKRAKGVPASFKAKAYASSAVAKSFPTIKSAAGKALADRLAPLSPVKRTAAPKTTAVKPTAKKASTSKRKKSTSKKGKR